MLKDQIIKILDDTTALADGRGPNVKERLTDQLSSLFDEYKLEVREEVINEIEEWANNDSVRSIGYFNEYGTHKSMSEVGIRQDAALSLIKFLRSLT